jgi:hypothetical protein
VVILGVLGGAGSGGFCFGVLAGASPPRKARWGGQKKHGAGVVPQTLRIYSYLRNTFFYLAVFLPS